MNPELIILRNLERGNKGIMTVPVLWAEVSLDRSGMTFSEFKKCLAGLETSGEVLVVTNSDRETAKITDTGRLRLMES